MKHREFTVLAKGILVARLHNVYNLAELLNKLKKCIHSITRYKMQLPKTLCRLFADVVLYISSVVTA